VTSREEWSATVPVHFNFPEPPETVFPAGHVWADLVIWAVAAVLAGKCLLDWRRTGSPLGLVLMAGGGIAYFNESVDDVLGLVHHPRPGLNIVLDTIGPVPMWGLPTYIIFFGAIPYLLLRAIQDKGFTLRTYWIGLFITFAADLAIELPLLQTDLYQYYSYGETPMTLARFPIYWLFINTTGPVLCAAVLYAVPGYFTGWRRGLLVLLPVVADASCSVAVGLPVYTVLHTEAVGAAGRWFGALLTCFIGLVLLDAFGRWILHRREELEREELAAPVAAQVDAETGR
jgi:UPF0716 family protein affecting phage T7 exclusion